ncbi:MAG: hypothetical protein FWD35_05395 [Oscillospiraceae bacterium]|nr:hypothetical protein [Oscillospiraceae bacterium]
MKFKLRRANSFRVHFSFKWLCYCGILLLLYMLMVGGGGNSQGAAQWQPILLIALAMAVAMRECNNELAVCVFGAVCGLVIDIASANLFGFSGIWLLPGCLTVSLLSSHLIKANLLNYIWLNALMCAVMAAADYFFNYALWDTAGHNFILTDFIIPAYLATIVFSPLLYLAVRGISRRFTLRESVKPYSNENESNGT